MTVSLHELIEATKEARRVCIEMHGYRDMGGYCAFVSWYSAILVRSPVLVIGTYYDGGYHCPHVWTETAGHIVDGTANQFSRYNKTVHVVRTRSARLYHPEVREDRAFVEVPDWLMYMDEEREAIDRLLQKTNGAQETLRAA